MTEPPFLIVLDNFLSKEECEKYITYFLHTELTIIDNGLAKYDRGILIDDTYAQELYRRCVEYIPKQFHIARANEYIRFSSYVPGGSFKIHKDGINQDSYGNRSVITVNIFLNDDFEGGETAFYHNIEKPIRYQVLPKMGRAAIFDSQQPHEGCEVICGKKFLLRTDLMAP